MEIKPYTKQLQSKGYKITPQRELILRSILELKSHFCIEGLQERVRTLSEAVNLTTIYRNLIVFEKSGIITSFSQGKNRVYALKDHGSHLHLVCQNCGAAIEADIDLVNDLEEKLLQIYGFSSDFAHLAIYGRCSHAECLE